MKHILDDDIRLESVKEVKEKRIFKCNYVSSVDHRVSALSVGHLNQLILEGKKSKLIEALKYFDDEIVGIELLTNKFNRIGTYIQHNTLGVVPITIFGDGLRKALLVAVKVIESENGVLLIDEVETGIHTKLIPQFIDWV